VAPTVLPETFAVIFTDVTAARKVRAKAVERKKKGKEPKDTWIQLIRGCVRSSAISGAHSEASPQMTPKIAVKTSC
jgi:hypothetical protein